MTSFADSYLGQLRRVIGDRLLLFPGARIVVEDDQGRILLHHRADFDIWGLPGGHAEAGETITEMVIRETLEEVGVTVAAPQPYGFSCDPAFETFVYPNGHKVHSFAMLFYARAFAGEARVADEESLAVGWFSPGALPPILPNMQRSIDAYLRFKAGGGFQMI